MAAHGRPGAGLVGEMEAGRFCSPAAEKSCLRDHGMSEFFTSRLDPAPDNPAANKKSF
jgi:hypothetical protein